MTNKQTCKIILRRKVPRECNECGEPATKKYGYLLPNFRSNPRSSAYGKDDCTWCSDLEIYGCANCKQPHPEGYGSASTWSKVPRFEHMFFDLEDEVIPVEVNLEMDGNMYHATFSDHINPQESPNGFGDTHPKAVANLFREAVGIRQAITDPENQPSQYGTTLVSQ